MLPSMPLVPLFESMVKDGIIEIKLNLNQANGRSIDIAASILHEAIHAELHRIYISNNTVSYSRFTLAYTQ